MKRKKVTKKQHHIPQMMLKRFTDTNNQICMYDREKKEWLYPRNIKSVGCRKHLYSIEDGDRKDDCLENCFSLIESDAEPVIERILSINKNTFDDVEKLVKFVVTLILRAPKFTEIVEKFGSSNYIARILEEQGRKERMPEDKIQRNLNNLKSKKGFSFAVTFDKLFEKIYSNLAENFDLYLCSSNTDNFIINDNYATFDTLDENVFNKIYQNLINWATLDIKVYCPIDSNHCLTFIPKKDKKRIGTDNVTFAECKISAENVSKINTLTVSQSERYAYCADPDEIKKYAKVIESS